MKGLPPTGSWQDIKDHMREAGEVLYAEVYGDGSGIVEFAHSDDVKYAVKNLDDTEFRSHEVSIYSLLSSTVPIICLACMPYGTI